MTKVLILGDTHSDDKFVASIHRVCKQLVIDGEEPVTTIVQLGDFGYNFDRNLIASIHSWLERDESHRWFWIDGNHDHHDYLDRLVGRYGKADAFSAPISMGAEPFLEDDTDRKKHQRSFHDRLFYVPRGATFMLGRMLCMGLGGAYSIDKVYRTPHVSWWPQELITAADMDRAERNARGKKIDVMFTHDAPTSRWLEENLLRSGYKVGPESRVNRKALSAIVDEVKPTRLFHGHYHHRYDAVYATPDGHMVNVHGIGANVSVPPQMGLEGQAIEGWNYEIADF